MIYSDFNSETNNYSFVKYKQNLAPQVEEPYLIVDQILDIVNNECVEKYRVRTMTVTEKNNKIASIQSLKPYPSWIFDEPGCRWVPPTPMPDGKFLWDENTTSWIPDIR